MNSTVESRVPPPLANVSAEQIPARVLKVRPEQSRILCCTSDGREIALSRLIGSNVRVGDEILVSSNGTGAAKDEVYIHKPSATKADVYQIATGYAALPKEDRRGELFVRARTVDAQLGIETLHIPCQVIRDYFFSANRNISWSRQPSFYYLLHLPEDVSSGELRLAYRVRRIELRKEDAPKMDLVTLERAYNMLADPELRSIYNTLRRNGAAPVPFPYSGFGSLIVRGERSSDTGVFFVNRILAFLPELRLRKVPVPLRKLDYFDDYAVLRDPRRKLEVLIDQKLLPIRWDPTWSQWRHLIAATVEISAEFVRTGRYRKRGEEWKFVECEKALPSRTELEFPEGLEEDILKARRTHSRFGAHWKHIDHLRTHVQRIPTERGELQRLCWNLGLPGDFDVAQITWRPDYDSFFYEQLITRARTMYLFRNEYIFDLEKTVVVEVPQAGHATYIFDRPPDIGDWVWRYAETTRRDIRFNRDNVAESLAFRGRIVHGKNRAEWAKELRFQIGELAEFPSAASQ